ncbi:MAG: pilus assembly protein PilM [Phycisphaerae bacterium]|nr:pilus assembly protein PilM [Phycisphaerae bacterium]
MPIAITMGFQYRCSLRSTKPPVAIHFGNDDVVRLMQISGEHDFALDASFEVLSTDDVGLKEATACFNSRAAVVSVPSSEILLRHIRVDYDANEDEVVQKLCGQNEAWSSASIRQLPIFTSIRGGPNAKLQQELLCVGVSHGIIDRCVSTVERAGMDVRRVTVPVHATLRAFDKLYRRDGDETITSMVVDLDKKQTIAMIAHGMNLVVASSLQFKPTPVAKQQWSSTPALIRAGDNGSNFERRENILPRGLAETCQTGANFNDTAFVEELRGCIRHHSTLFPERAIDRLVFCGSGALQTELCSSVANALGLEGYIADPSAWIRGAEELASGPTWTTVAGLCFAHAGGSQ